MWHWDSCFHAIAWRADRSGARARRAAHRAALGARRTASCRTRSSGTRRPAGGARRCTRRAGSLGDRCTETIGPPLLAFAWEIVADASPDEPGLSHRGAARRSPRTCAGSSSERDPDGDGLLTIVAARRVGPRRLAEVRPGLRPPDARPRRLRAAHGARPPRAAGTRATLIARYDHHVEDVLGQRRVRAVAARDGAPERRRVVERRGRRASSRRCSSAARRAHAACSSTSPAAPSGPCRVSTWSALSPLVLPGCPSDVRRAARRGAPARRRAATARRSASRR